jgi:hypothetical protein
MSHKDLKTMRIANFRVRGLPAVADLYPVNAIAVNIFHAIAVPECAPGFPGEALASRKILHMDAVL